MCTSCVGLPPSNWGGTRRVGVINRTRRANTNPRPPAFSFCVPTNTERNRDRPADDAKTGLERCLRDYQIISGQWPQSDVAAGVLAGRLPAFVGNTSNFRVYLPLRDLDGGGLLVDAGGRIDRHRHLGITTGDWLSSTSTCGRQMRQRDQCHFHMFELTGTMDYTLCLASTVKVGLQPCTRCKVHPHVQRTRCSLSTGFDQEEVAR